MKDSIKIFNNPQFGEIRTAGSANNPMFCLADVCKVLDLQVTPTKNRLKQDGVNSIKVIDNLGREQNAIFVNEQNLYKVIMRSDKPQAEPFQDWVCGEVLPSIRKSGGYNSKPLSTLDLLELTIKGMRENQLELQEVKKDVLELKAQVTTRPDYYTVVGYGTLHGISVNIKMASSIGRKASNICKERGLDTDTIPDPRFGVVKTYPSKVLDEAFRMPLTPKTNN